MSELGSGPSQSADPLGPAPGLSPSASPPASPAAPTSPPPRPAGRRRRGGRLALGVIQLGALLGVVGLAVIAGAILVQDTSVPGWIDGLAIGAGSVIATLVVLFNGRRARPD